MPDYPLSPAGNTPAGWTGVSANPSSPAGGNGPGHSQGYAISNPRVDPHNSLLSRVFSASTWSELEYVGKLLLGPESYFLGVCYGIVRNLADSVLSLLGLLKMFILAGLYEQAQHSWFDPMALPGHLADEIPYMHRQMQKSSEDVKALVAEVVKIFKNPVKYAELFAGDMKTKGIEKWNRYLRLAQSTELSNQFEAGEMFGEMLAEVVMTILLFVSGVGAAARGATAAARFAKELPELFKVVDVLQGAEELKGAAEAGKVAEEAKAVEEAAKAAKPNLPPITRTYGKNTVTWFRDADGNVTRVEADIKESFSGLKRSSAERSAQGDTADTGLTDDAGGHIVGHRFVGDQGDVNMFPQNSNFNNSAYKTMENEFADWTKNGKEVDATFTFDPPGAVRPDSVTTEYNVVDPATSKVVYSNNETFLNQSGQTFDRVKASDMGNY